MMTKTADLVSLKHLIKAGGLPGFLLLFHNILIFIVKRRRSLDDAGGVDASAGLQILFTAIVFGLVFHFFFLNRSEVKTYLFRNPNYFLWLFSIVCALSMLWTPQLALTGYRAFEAITYLCLISWTVYKLSKNLDAQNMVEWLVFWGIWGIFWSAATTIKGSLQWFLMQPFDVARLDYPAVLFFALLLTKRKWFKYIILILALLSVSNKIYLGFALGLIGFFFGDSKDVKIIALLGIVLLLSVTIFIDIETLLKNTVFYGREEISYENSSGRDKIWEVAWEAFLNSPILGYGFVSGETTILYEKFQGAINSHNSMFSSLLGTGIVGGIFIVGYFRSAVLTAFNRHWPVDKWKPAAIGTVMMCLTLSALAPGVGSRVFGSWISVVLSLTMLKAINDKFKEESIQDKTIKE
jgi:hypothetical protein